MYFILIYQALNFKNIIQAIGLDCNFAPPSTTGSYRSLPSWKQGLPHVPTATVPWRRASPLWWFEAEAVGVRAEMHPRLCLRPLGVGPGGPRAAFFTVLFDFLVCVCVCARSLHSPTYSVSKADPRKTPRCRVRFIACLGFAD